MYFPLFLKNIPQGSKFLYYGNNTKDLSAKNFEIEQIN